MGRFEINPSAGKQYKAYVRVGGNQLTVVIFRAVLPKGNTLKVISGQNNLTISATSNFEGDNRPLYLLIHTRGLVKSRTAFHWIMGKAS